MTVSFTCSTAWGQFAWVQRYNFSGDLFVAGVDEATAIALDSDGKIYVTGRSQAKVGELNPQYDFATIRYWPNGTVDQGWNNGEAVRYPGPAGGDDSAVAIAVYGSGDSLRVYVTGYAVSANGTDFVTIKYKGDGSLAAEEWPNAGHGDAVRRFDGPSSLDAGSPESAVYKLMVVDASGNVYLTGETTDLGSPKAATWKFGPDLTEVWQQVEKSPEYGAGIGIAIDGNQNVFMAASVGTLATGGDYFAAEYDTNGTRVWSRYYTGPGWGEDSPSALALDSAVGAPYVTGGAYYGPAPGETGTDYATVFFGAPASEETYAPTALTPLRGYDGYGNVQSLAADDDDYYTRYLKWGTDDEASPNDPDDRYIAAFECEAQVNNAAYTFARVKVVTRTDLGLSSFRVKAWNYTTASWTWLYNRAASGTAEVTIDLPLPTPVADYIGPGDRKMKLRVVNYLTPGGMKMEMGDSFYPAWRHRTDLVEWTLYP